MLKPQARGAQNTAIDADENIEMHDGAACRAYDDFRYNKGLTEEPVSPYALFD